MKTKELIRQLQKEDPSGEEEVCVDNVDIFFVEKLPAYYDGHFQVLVRDPAQKPYYDVVGVEIRGTGYKIQIHTHHVETALIDNPEMPVTFDREGSHLKSSVEQWRQECREIHRKEQK